MPPENESLGTYIEEFLQQLAHIDAVQQHIEVLRDIEEHGNTRLREQIEDARAAIRAATTYLRTLTQERRREERVLLRLRRESGLEIEASRHPRRSRRTAPPEDPRAAANRVRVVALKECRQSLVARAASIKATAQQNRRAMTLAYALLRDR